jgi:hypothetical protein
MSCGTITIGSSPSCTSPLKAGTEPRLYLFNYDEVLSGTAGTTPNLLTALVLQSNTVGFVFEGFKQDVKPTQEVIAPGNGANQLKHNLGFVVYDITQVQKNNLQKVVKGRFVAIVENKGKGAEAFEVYGMASGLEIVPGVARDSYANGGGYIIQLATPENEFEPLLPQTIYDTDYATTKAKLDDYAGLPTVTVVSDLAISTSGSDAETITGTNFYGGLGSTAVTLVEWENQATKALTTQTAVTTASDTSLTFSSVALAAGTYRLKVTTLRGVARSSEYVVVS